MKQVTSVILSIFFLLLTTTSYGWSEHALGVYPALEASRLVTSHRPVKVEELQSFLMKHEKEIETLLSKEEKFALANFESYQPLPDQLVFKANGDSATVVERFMKAIRVNPKLKPMLYLQADTRKDCGKRPKFNHDIAIFNDKSLFAQINFCKIQVGELVSALEVLGTAVDEPDHGMDVDLFSDSHTSFGHEYGFGETPFGDPRSEYGSQAPFHMGFYHEAGIVFTAAPFLKKNFPAYRSHVYRSLAIFALKNGDDYWGLRFLGWGLHFVTDLTQPYHSSVLPGVSTIRMLWINILAMVGFESYKENAINLVANRHTALEELQWSLLHEISVQHQFDHPLLKALADRSTDDSYAKVDDRFLQDVVSKEAESRSVEVDALLVNALPAKYVNDPAFVYSPEDKAKVLDEARNHGDKSYKALTGFLERLFRSLGAHSRNYVESALLEAQTN